MSTRNRVLMAVLMVLGLTPVALAQNADDYRGGWRTEDRDPLTIAERRWILR